VYESADSDGDRDDDESDDDEWEFGENIFNVLEEM